MRKECGPEPQKHGLSLEKNLLYEMTRVPERIRNSGSA